MKPVYCLTCAQPLNRLNDTDYICPNGHVYWNGPHCGTSIIFLKDGQVLATERKEEPFKGKYCFPGGFANHAEQPWATAIREAKEETGAVILPQDLKLLDAHTVQYTEAESTTSLIYLVKHWQGELAAGDDAARLVWKPIDFINTSEFCWHFPGLADKLLSIAATGSTGQK